MSGWRIATRAWAAGAELHLAPVLAVVGLLAVLACASSADGDRWPFVAAAMFSGWRPRRNNELPDKTEGSSPPGGPPEPPALEQVLNALDIAAIVLNADRRVAALNRPAADLFPGVSPGDTISLATRNPDILQAIDRVFLEGQRETIEITERSLQGRRFLVSATLLTGPALLLQFRDTSEQARLAQLRADFIANASHELRTPLASIKGFIETLQGPARDDAGARQRFLDIMAVQAQRMNRILDDLLSLSRIEMRAHLKPEGEVDMSDVVAHVMRMMEPLAREAEVSLRAKEPGVGTRVRGDRDELEQVIQNLVHNAIKYGRKGGQVDVEIGRRRASKGNRGFLTVTITDNGPGIAPEHLPRLTERFYRVDTARSRERGGTGLGLAIVKHILNRHKGELEIASEVGRGSIFTVVLEASPH